MNMNPDHSLEGPTEQIRWLDDSTPVTTLESRADLASRQDLGDKISSEDIETLSKDAPKSF